MRVRCFSTVRRVPRLFVLAAGLLLAAGCAKDRRADFSVLTGQERIAWSISNPREELTVAASPVRQTLQILGSAGTVLGFGISAAQDAAYAKAISDALGEYSPGTVFEQRLADALAKHLGENARRVGPVGTAAGFANQQEAKKARWEGLARSGHSQVLDLDIACGVFGPEGTLVTRVSGELRALPGGKLLWRDTVTVHSGPVLASRRLSDPTNRLTPNIAAPRLTIAENAIGQWTADGGKNLRESFEGGVRRTVEGLLTALELEETADGYLTLGWNAMCRKRYAEAGDLLHQAQEMSPERADILNVMAVNLGHAKDEEGAVKMAREALSRDPNHAEAHFNLAWWLSEDRQTLDEARTHYEAALAAGAPDHPRLEKRLKD